MAEIKAKLMKTIIEINWAMTLSSMEVGQTYHYDEENGFRESLRAMGACNRLKTEGRGIYSVNRNKDYKITGKFSITRTL